jgi:small GTP-binding protein
MIRKKICMVGTYAVGKTSLVRRFVESLFDERYQTTVGVKVDKKLLDVTGREVTLVLWDMAGEDDLALVRTSHLRGAAGYVLVADGTRPATLAAAEGLRERILEELGALPFVLVINKSDLADQWQVTPEDLGYWRSKGWKVFVTSARTGENVEEMFRALAADVMEIDDAGTASN